MTRTDDDRDGDHEGTFVAAEELEHGRLKMGRHSGRELPRQQMVISMHCIAWDPPVFPVKNAET